MELKRIPVVDPEYAQLEKFTDDQLKIFWLPDEVKVEKDVQDVLVNFTPAERHGVITTLKLFSLYEDFAGEEFWGGRFKRMYETNTIAVRMASAFSMTENCIHSPFYGKINELLHINTPEFYMSFRESDTLKARMTHVGNIIDEPDDLVSLAMFSMVEGVILYSNFAFLKHFQSQGKNKLLNLNRGIQFSLRDENLHSVAGAWCFRKMANDLLHSQPELYQQRMADVEAKIRFGAAQIMEHEREIINIIFEQGRIDGITNHQLDVFVQSRINECMAQLGFTAMYEIKSNPIAEWFYKGINDYTFNDFFSGMSSQYHRNWDETAFTWNTTNKDTE